MIHRFPAEISKLHPILKWVREQLAQSDFDSKVIGKIELACEEAIVNIIQHAYAGGSGEIEIEVVVVPKNRVEITLKDQGPAFDPLKNDEIDPTQDIDERDIGGLGIHFIRQCMDEIHYRRESNRNILILIKNDPTHSSRKR